MDVLQKYSEETEGLPYMVDDMLIDQLKELPMPLALDIAKQIDENYTKACIDCSTDMTICGVCNVPLLYDEDPIYFKVMYFVVDKMPIFFAVFETTLNEYLDHVLENKAIV